MASPRAPDPDRRREHVMIPAVEERADELRRLCLAYGVQRLDLFGSASTGLYDGDESDLDFLVEFQPAALSAYADAYFGLLEALGALFGKLSADSSGGPWTLCVEACGHQAYRGSRRHAEIFNSRSSGDPARQNR